ncbi:class I SAM-dependent methyltransferase [Solibacillus silvestris]|uniref:class I SAM-dependent methyltransferase n=1 Tax=Solibacillus silvestris TaxID=76853 RepID=UPI003F7EA217
MEHLLNCMKIIGDDTIQRTQLTHRLELVNAFQLDKGMKVLEIGCGQGDTTIVLADAVGPAGHVVAIDIAPKEYGAPITLGEAAEAISKSSLGQIIDFHYETDFLQFDAEEKFDVVVLSHCSWYFQSTGLLESYMQKLKQIAHRICFAEWDIDYKHFGQRAHFYAANISALYTAYVENEGNIQNLFHKKQIKELLQTAGFTITKEQTVDASYLQDGGWEVDYSNYLLGEFPQVQPKIQSLINSYAYLMNEQQENILSLNSFVICAHS